MADLRWFAVLIGMVVGGLIIACNGRWCPTDPRLVPFNTVGVRIVATATIPMGVK